METIKTVSINKEQGVYIFNHAEGQSCLGFQNAWDELVEILSLGIESPGLPSLDELESARITSLYGSLKLYAYLQQAQEAYCASALASSTFFHRTTPDPLRKVIERLRWSGQRVRCWYGDRQTGHVWLQEYDTVGRIGRSTGPMRIPLLVRCSEDGGGDLSESSLLRVRRLSDGKTLWKNSSFVLPEFKINQEEEHDSSHSVVYRYDEDEWQTYSRHKSYVEACALIVWFAGEEYNPDKTQS